MLRNKRAIAKTNHVVPQKRRGVGILDIPTLPEVQGKVLVCGQGCMGQLGLGDDDTWQERKRPTPIASIENAIDVVAGGMHSLVLTSEGDVYSFGCNDEGALGRDCTEEGSDFEPGMIILPSKAIMISAGDSHSACLLDNGRVYAWGSFRDSHGNMGLTTDGNKRTPFAIMPFESFCCIASGADHLVILSRSGTVYTFGCGEQGQLGRVSLRTATGIGRRGRTELLCPSKVFYRSNLLAEQIWTSQYCTYTRMSNGHIYAFGLNNYKQCLVTKGAVDETVITPTKTDLTDVKDIVGGAHHTIVLKNDGTCHVVGRADYGRLGLGHGGQHLNSLKQVSALAGKIVTKIAAGESQSFALTADGKMYAWGMGSNHQLGLGSDDDAHEPKLVESLHTTNRRIISVSSGGQHSMFIASPELIAAQPDEKDKSPVQPIIESVPRSLSRPKRSSKATDDSNVSGSTLSLTNGITQKKEEKTDETSCKPKRVRKATKTSK